MRSLLIVACLLGLSGCYDPGANVGQASLPVSTSGRVGSDASCTGGQLFFQLDQQRGDELAATVYYESDAIDGERYRATYRVEGLQSDDKVVLDEVEMLESDPLPPNRQWCTGRYTLTVGSGDERGVASLAGSYESTGCGCSGETTLGNSGT